MFLICKYDLLPILIFFNLRFRNHIIMQLSLAMYFVSQAPGTLKFLPYFTSHDYNYYVHTVGKSCTYSYIHSYNYNYT